MQQRNRRGFSVVGVVVALGLMVTLGGVALGALSATRCGRSPHLAMRSRLVQLQVALAMYEADHGRYPLGSSRLDDDDAPWLFVALTYPPSLGGGANAPYVDWPQRVGVLQTGVGAPVARPLTPAERGRLRDPAFLAAHAPGGPTALVFLDDWGRPLHGRSWARLRLADHERLEREPWVRGPFDALPAPSEAPAPIAHTVEDRPHTDDFGWDLWSAGANGVNEYGASCSDDVTSWPADAPAADCSCGRGWTSSRARGGGLLALTGVLGAVGLIARVRLRRAHAPKAPPRVDLHPRAATTRCAFCHATDRRTPLVACSGCGAGLHVDCWGDAGACPTLGCA